MTKKLTFIANHKPLARLFAGGLVGKMRVVILFLSLLAGQAYAQKSVTGVVKDDQGNTLPGVVVKVKGGTASGVTDANGKFSINTDANGTLIFSFLGFKPQEVSIGGRGAINVALLPDVTNLKEVVVTGYGSQSRETLTTSVSKLNQKTLENVPYTSALSALQGSVSGVQVQSVTGQPGQPPRVVLRGGTSLNNTAAAGTITANSPLYLVDGVIRANLADVAADDIESMQILKDAASTSIYGARASNGVVLVTTKSGKAGVTKVSYSYDLSVADDGDRNMKYVNARDYIYYERVGTMMATPKLGAATVATRMIAPSAYGTGNDLSKTTAFTTQYLTPANQYKLNEGWESLVDPYDPTKTIIFKNTDYQALSHQTAISHNHFVTASGGTEKAKFNAGIGYLMAEGTAINSDYNRLTANLNSSLQVTDKLKINGRVLFSSTDFLLISPETAANSITNGNLALQSTGGNLSNIFYRSAALPGSTKYQFEDGTMAPGVNNSLGNPDYYQQGPFAPQRKNTGEKLTVAISGTWNILPGLTFDPLLSYYKDEQFGRSFQPAFLSGITTLNTQRAVNQYQVNTNNLQGDAVFTYSKSFSNHNIEAKAGYSYFKRDLWTINAAGINGATDNVLTVNGAATASAPGGNENQFVTEGVFARLNYNYDQKYLVMLTARRDGASNLGASNRFGFFPGVGLGWNVHRENFWKSAPKQISSLKLRATYGENGNIGVLSDYGWQGTYSVGNQYNGGAAIITGDLPNLGLQWEHSKTFDVGLDLGLFDNRATLIFDYYNRKTDNLLALVLLPTSSGYSNITNNNGSLGNKGVEGELNVSVFEPTKAFQWNVNFNATKVSNKVLQLPFNGVPGNRQNGIEVWDVNTKQYIWVAAPNANSTANFSNNLIEGSRMGDLYAYKLIGVYATDAEAQAPGVPYDEGATTDFGVGVTTKKKFGGDAIFQDTDGNGIINSKDQVYVGNMFPKWTGGFSNYFTYKGFNMAIRTDFTLGHTIYNYGKAFADGQLQGDALPTQDFIDKSWKKQGDITMTPRYVHQVNGNVSRSSAYYEKGDFLCLREVTLGYSLPSSITKKIKLNGVRLNLTGSNLYYLTKYSGANPEEGGVDNGRYPNPRTVTLGANVTF